MSSYARHIKFGDNLDVTDEGAGTIRVDATAGGTGGTGHTIRDEGTALAARASLDFVGAGVTATDNPAGDKTLVTIPGGGATVSYGTTLPASPVDGQEAIVVDSITAPTYQWRLRYNAGSTSIYKWESLGGPPTYSEWATGGSVSIASGTFQPIPNPKTYVTLPFEGYYDLEYGGSAAVLGTTAIDVYFAPFNQSNAQLNWDNEAWERLTTQYAKATILTRRRLLAAAAGHQWDIRAKAAGAAADIFSVRIAASPVRVKAV